uniref:THAP-type domain-containing protein n=1 Tax=Romanomermis culicivorax TaxID=13658 RepID=A0A915HI16_ROMCU
MDYTRIICVVKNCNARPASVDERHNFFSFPPQRAVRVRSIWLENVNLGSNFKPGRYDCVCSKHFVEGHPTSRNPCPDVDMGWECPKRPTQISSSGEQMNRSINELLQPKIEMSHARKLLGMSDVATPVEASLNANNPAKMKRISSFQDYCSVSGCPNCSYVLRRMGLRCEATLFPLETVKNETVRAAWLKFANLTYGQSTATRGQICSLHFVGGRPSAENPVPTIYPQFEWSHDSISKAKNKISAEKSAENLTTPAEKDGSESPKIKKIKLVNINGKACVSVKLPANTKLPIVNILDWKILAKNDVLCANTTGLCAEILEILIDYIKFCENEAINGETWSISGKIDVGKLTLIVLSKLTSASTKTDSFFAGLLNLHIDDLRNDLQKFIPLMANALSKLIFWPANLHKFYIVENHGAKIYGIFDLLALPNNAKFAIIFDLNGALIFRSGLMSNNGQRPTEEKFFVRDLFDHELKEKKFLFDNQPTTFYSHKDFSIDSIMEIGRYNPHRDALEHAYRSRLTNFSIFSDQKSFSALFNEYGDFLDHFLTICCALSNLKPFVDYKTVFSDWRC